jgi:hypothetical protein
MIQLCDVLKIDAQPVFPSGDLNFIARFPHTHWHQLSKLNACASWGKLELVALLLLFAGA